MDYGFAIIVFFLSAGVIVVFVLIKSGDGFSQSLYYSKKHRALETRIPLSDEDFAQAFPPQQKEISLKVRQLIAEQLGLNRTLIRPSDNLPEDLGVGTWLDNLADVELVEEFEKTFNITINDYEAERAKTVADAVSLVANCRQRRAREIATMIPPRLD